MGARAAMRSWHLIPRSSSERGATAAGAIRHRQLCLLVPALAKLGGTCLLVLALAGCLAQRRQPYSGLESAGGPTVAFASRATPGAGPPALALTPAGERGRYRVFRFSMPSAGANGQRGNLVTGRYFQAPGPRARGLLIVLPIWGGSRYPPWVMTRRFTVGRLGGEFHVLRIDGERGFVDWDGLARVEGQQELWREVLAARDRLQATIADIDRLADWARTRPEVNSRRLGLVGFSVGAIVGALTIGGEPRFAAAALVMGGGHPHEVLATCGDEALKARSALLPRLGWSEQRLSVELERRLRAVDPVLVASRVDPSRVLVVEAVRDRCIPRTAREDLWRAMGRPERIRIFGGHKLSFLSMTFLNGHSVTRAVAAFLAERLRSPATPAPLVAAGATGGPK